VKISIGGRTGLQKFRNPGLFKENGSIEPWIFDPTAPVAVDLALSPVHGSTVEQANGYPLDVSMRRAAAGTPGQRGDNNTRRRFAGVSPGRGS
jgi:hypothetical protein